MKRFVVVAIATVALLVPALVTAQGWTFVYRPELHGMVPVPPPASTAAAAKAPLTPVEVIARHTAMGARLRTNGTAHGAIGVAAADHCDRLVATARKSIRANF